MADEMRLSKRSAITLFVWYIIVFIASSLFLLKIFLAPDLMKLAISFDLALTGSVAAALISSALFYLRKLYKGLFALQDGTFAVGEFNAIEVATFIYFLSRPLFAILFSFLAVISSAMFIHTTTEAGTKFSIGFLFFTILLSSYGAAATGWAVQHLENTGRQKIRMFGGAS